MADFCKQCSIYMFGEDFQDLAGIVEEPQLLDTICEGCGPTTVNMYGECVSSSCLERHVKCPVVEEFHKKYGNIGT